MHEHPCFGDLVGRDAPQRRPRLEQLDLRLRRGGRQHDADGLARPGVAHAHHRFGRLAVRRPTVAVARGAAVAVVPRHVDDLQIRPVQRRGGDLEDHRRAVVAPLFRRLDAQVEHASGKLEAAAKGEGQLTPSLRSEDPQRGGKGHRHACHVGHRLQRDRLGRAGPAVGHPHVDEGLLAGVEPSVGEQRFAVVELELGLQRGRQRARRGGIGDRRREDRRGAQPVDELIDRHRQRPQTNGPPARRSGAVGACFRLREAEAAERLETLAAR